MQSKQKNTKNDLGRLLRALRLAARIKLREVSRRAEVSAAFLSDIELGRRLASDDVLEKIAAAIGTDARQLTRAAARSRLAKLEEEAIELRRAAR